MAEDLPEANAPEVNLASSISPEAPPAPSPKMAAHVFLVGLALLASSTMLARSFMHGVETITPLHVFQTITINYDRFRALLDAVPSIAAQPGRTALFMGNSPVVFDFSPELFDGRLREQGIELSTRNLGVVTFPPYEQLLLAKRLRAAYVRAGRRSTLSLIAWDPAASTYKFSRGKRSIFLHDVLLMGPQELFRYFWKNPSRTIQLASTRILGGLGSQEVTRCLSDRIFHAGISRGVRDAPSWWWGKHEPPPDPEALANEKLAQTVDRHYAGLVPRWDRSLRGEWRRLFPENRQEYADALRFTQSDEAMKEAVWFWDNINDIVQLHIEEEQVDAFIQAVNELKSVSDRVILVMVPMNTKWYKMSPEGEKRVRTATDRVLKETGVPMIDYFFVDTNEFDASDFHDLTHLHELTGRGKFSLSLADRVAAILNKPTL